MISKTSSKDFEVAIVGGGIAGVVLAIALCRRSIRCTIYEQAAAFGEIGAGVGMHPNAVRAMKICDSGIATAFDKVVTTNGWPSKKHVWFDFLDGTADTPAPELRPLFQVCRDDKGHGACHRARFLDELVRLLPTDVARFHKRLEGVEGDPHGEGRLTLRFSDGSSAEADAVVGCDGIKSRLRAIVLGSRDHPAAKCTYSHKFAYRGLIPMGEAIKALGEEKALNASLWMGPDRHVLTFPVNHGTTLNLVAFVTSEEEWPSDVDLTVPSTREAALADFAAFGPTVKNLIRLTKEKPERWGLFDLAAHPLPTFCRGRVCVAGDAAHASTPHHGAGAGFCVEDAAVLASLLANERVQTPQQLADVFAAFDACRRERAQWLVRSSRQAADMYEWRAPELGHRYDERIQREIYERQGRIWDYDLDKAIEEARRDLNLRLGSTDSGRS